MTAPLALHVSPAGARSGALLVLNDLSAGAAVNDCRWRCTARQQMRAAGRRCRWC